MNRRPLPGSFQQWTQLGQAVAALVYLGIGYWAGTNALSAWFFVGAITVWIVDILVITPRVERRRRAKALRDILAAVGGTR